MTRRHKKLEEDMPPSAAKIEDNTNKCRISFLRQSPSISFLDALAPKRAFFARSYFLLSSSIFLLSCLGNTILHSYKPLPPEAWERRDTIFFDLPQASEDFSATLTIGLRLTAPVTMQEVVLAVEQQFDSPAAFRRDTVHYPLTDDDGFALGSGVNFLQYEMQHLPLRMQKGQQGRIRIHHLMRHEDLSGIREIGVKVERE